MATLFQFKETDKSLSQGKNRAKLCNTPLMSKKISNFAFDIKRLKFDMEKINRIKAVLAEEGKTGKWLAEQVGRDPVTVSKWCTNSSQPDLPTLNKIANVLGADIADLLCRTHIVSIH